MKKCVLIYLIIHFTIGLFSQNYKVLEDETGIDIGLSQVDRETESDKIIQSLPSDFRSHFKVFSSGYYIPSKDFHSGMQNNFQRSIDTAEVKSDFYLLIVREVDQNNLIKRFYVDLKLPTTDSLNCLNSNGILLLRTKIESIVSKYINNSNIDFIQAEIEALIYLNAQLEYIVHCCHVNNNNGQCELKILTNEDILKDLYERGYEGVPIEVINGIGIQNIHPNSRATCNIENYSLAQFKIGDVTNCNIYENLCSFIESLPTGLSNKIYITDNVTYDGFINEIITDFVNNEYDIAAHFHIYDSDKDYVPDLILYFDYSTIDLAWCPYLEDYDPQHKFYSKFQFAGPEPLTLTDNLTGTVGFWRRVFADGQNNFIIYTNKYALQHNISNEDIYFFDISEDISLLTEILQIYLELNIDMLQFDSKSVRFAIINEPILSNGDYIESLDIFRDQKYQFQIKDYYGWDENSSHFNCGHTIGAKWDLFWTSDVVPIPIIDDGWALEYLNCPPTYYEAGKSVIKRLPKKAAYLSGNIWKVYTYKVGKLFYHGITSREFEERLAEHITKVTKNGQKIVDDKLLYDNIDQATAKGIEQMFISWHKDLVGNARNIINSVSPFKVLPGGTKAYKDYVDKAYNYLKNTPGIALPPGYDIEKMYDFAKSYYTQVTSLPW
ncbi:MAG TPA: hypothetical protein VFG10_13415 [Saprospiraceae bacterium]|nr:hypothetical protein [Saprospiraceae bacterium]